MSANILHMSTMLRNSNFRITLFVGGEMESAQDVTQNNMLSEVKQSGVILLYGPGMFYDVAGLSTIFILPQYAGTITYVSLVQETNVIYVMVPAFK